MKYKTSDEIINALTLETVMEWMTTEQNEIDWAVEHCALDQMDDEQKEGVYHFVRKRFITVLIENKTPDIWPYATLALLRVTADELDEIVPLSKIYKEHVSDMLTHGKPRPAATETPVEEVETTNDEVIYQAEGKQALVVGFGVGLVVGLGVVALLAALRK